MYLLNLLKCSYATRPIFLPPRFKTKLLQNIQYTVLDLCLTYLEPPSHLIYKQLCTVCITNQADENLGFPVIHYPLATQ